MKHFPKASTPHPVMPEPPKQIGQPAQHVQQVEFSALLEVGMKTEAKRRIRKKATIRRFIKSPPFIGLSRIDSFCRKSLPALNGQKVQSLINWYFRNFALLSLNLSIPYRWPAESICKNSIGSEVLIEAVNLPFEFMKSIILPGGVVFASWGDIKMQLINSSSHKPKEVTRTGYKNP